MSATNTLSTILLRRKLKKLGAPPWVCHIAPMMQGTLSLISTRLFIRNRYLIKNYYRRGGYAAKDARAKTWAVDSHGETAPTD
jgi:hypothetical protein